MWRLLLRLIAEIVSTSFIIISLLITFDRSKNFIIEDRFSLAIPLVYNMKHIFINKQLREKLYAPEV
jgi:hypothetical protein